MESEADVLSSFDGVARLFPLPDFVLFPHVVAPLHIFEPRYREMARDALATDRLITLVLIKPGFEEEHEGRPPLFEVGCLGHIINEQRLPDGKFNLLVRGLCRLRLQKELPSAKSYRLAKALPLPDPPYDAPTQLREQVAEAVMTVLPAGGEALKQTKELLDSGMPLGGLCDILSFALPLSSAARQEMLGEPDIEERAQRLIAELNSGRVPELLLQPRELRRWPPEFSAN